MQIIVDCPHIAIYEFSSRSDWNLFKFSNRTFWEARQNSRFLFIIENCLNIRQNISKAVSAELLGPNNVRRVGLFHKPSRESKATLACMLNGRCYCHVSRLQTWSGDDCCVRDHQLSTYYSSTADKIFILKLMLHHRQTYQFWWFAFGRLFLPSACKSFRHACQILNLFNMTENR